MGFGALPKKTRTQCISAWSAAEAAMVSGWAVRDLGLWGQCGRVGREIERVLRASLGVGSVVDWCGGPELAHTFVLHLFIGYLRLGWIERRGCG